MYLTETAAAELFEFLGRFPAGSELILTFSPDGKRTEADRRFEERVASVGEPLQNFISEEALVEKLKLAGFHQVAFVSPAEIASRYLRTRSDGLTPPRRTTLARARV